MPTRAQAAQRVADMINEAEQAMDIAMAKTSAMVTQLPTLQFEAGLNAAWAQPVVVSMCAALGDMTNARGSIINVHKSLAAIQRKLGLTLMESPTNTKGEDGPVHQITGRAVEGRVVALRA